MPWQIPMIGVVLVSYVLMPVLIKRISKAPNRTRNLVWQYLFCAAISIMVATIARVNLLDYRLLVIALAIGVPNALACYCQWRAVDISLSKTSVATQWDDMTSLALGYLILNEAAVLNAPLVVGIILSVGAALFFTLTKNRNGGKKEVSKSRTLGLWILVYSLIWGWATFSMRYFALKGVPLPAYVAAWYTGSLLGAVGTYFIAGKKEAGDPLTLKQIVKVLPLSIAILTSLSMQYWTKIMVPITIFQPIAQVAEMVLPTLIGLYYFKEVKDLKTLSKIIFAVGIAGGLIIAFAYRH